MTLRDPHTPRRFAILKAGTANRLARERLGDFSGMFQTLFGGDGAAWDVVDVQHGQFPEDVTAYDGYVVTGSRASAYDQDPWVLRLLDTVRDIHARQIPLLGMCFGHQAIGLALGGAVEPNPRGWDVGARALELTATGRGLPLLADAPTPLAIHKLHADVVTRLPPGAVHLARSAHAEHESFAVGNTTLCLQGHAEFDDDVIREAVERLEGAKLLTADQAQASRASLSLAASRAFWQPRLRQFFAQGGLAVPVTATQRVRR
ncbi:MAG TPA: type 1 glutamine amidotransferase [bacterium]